MTTTTTTATKRDLSTTSESESKRQRRRLDIDDGASSETTGRIRSKDDETKNRNNPQERSTTTSSQHHHDDDDDDDKHEQPTHPNDDDMSPTTTTTTAPTIMGKNLPKSKLTSSTVFIGNLHPRVAQVHLEKLMERCGTVRRIHLVMQPHSRTQHKGFAFCEFSTKEEAWKAMQQLNGRKLLNQTLAVRPAKGDSSGESSSSTTTTTTTITRSALPKEKRAVETKIQAVKRQLEKLQQAQKKQKGT